MKKVNLKGTGVAIVTPFKTDGSVDFLSLKTLVKDCINGGIDYLVVMGTTGESAVLSPKEKQAVLAEVQKTNAGCLPIVLGIGGNNTAEVVKAVKTCPTGVDAILSVCPYYNRPSQDGMYQHFSAIAKASNLPVIVYNVPSRTSSNILPSTVLKLAKTHTNICAVKEASGDLNQAMEIIQNKTKDFVVLSGDDALTCAMTLMGGDGVISVQAMAAPKLFSDMVHFARKGKKKKALALHYAQYQMMNLIFEEGNPVGIKQVLKQRGIIASNTVRLPLVSSSKSLNKKLKTALEKLS
ncbi:MAG: 4-hydroxy-tetrahydrodipicolinate synthase [Flavobacteriales bacterium]